MAMSSDIDGNGLPVARAPLPSGYERFAVLVDWVERKSVPAMSLRVTGGGRSMPLCSYPFYPKYAGGPATDASSYTCSTEIHR
jgi:feruloyl esterase